MSNIAVKIRVLIYSNIIETQVCETVTSSAVVDLLFYVPPIVCGGSVVGFVLVCITLCPN